VFQELRRRFWLVDRFIGPSLVVTTISYYILKIIVSIAHVTSHTKSSNSSSDHTAVPLELRNSSEVNSQVKVSQGHITTDGQSVSKSWCRAPSGPHDQIFITVWQLRSCFMWGALSEESMGLSFVYATGPCQRCLSQVRVPWYSRPYFTVSFETSLFVASYDSQGHGGGIRPRRHTGCPPHNPFARTEYKTPFPTLPLLLHAYSLPGERVYWTVA
jgi:hypothetical protein